MDVDICHNARVISILGWGHWESLCCPRNSQPTDFIAWIPQLRPTPCPRREFWGGFESHCSKKAPKHFVIVMSDLETYLVCFLYWEKDMWLDFGSIHVRQALPFSSDGPIWVPTLIVLLGVDLYHPLNSTFIAHPTIISAHPFLPETCWLPVISQVKSWLVRWLFKASILMTRIKILHF